MILYDPLLILSSALLALLLDRLFGEYPFIRHPVILMGDFIRLFENHYYANSIVRGGILLICLLLLTGLVACFISWSIQFLPRTAELFITGFVASMLFAHRMLYDSVNHILNSTNKQQALSMLVSRDTAQLSESECYKGAMETYAENLSDGVVAPLFWFLLAGLPGLVIYKAINTLDSMVGYRTERYERYGKASAKLDDIVNWFPARITALLIMLLAKQWAIWRFYPQGRLHESPNAGHPICAMALHCDCQLGGDTFYFGQLKHKPFFGLKQASKQIKAEHLQKALALRTPIDLSLFLIIFSLIMVIYVL